MMPTACKKEGTIVYCFRILVKICVFCAFRNHIKWSKAQCLIERGGLASGQDVEQCIVAQDLAWH
jgi:hypothetical protein